MKRVQTSLLIGGSMLIVGFIAGRVLQHAKTGYHYKVLEQKQYSSALGPIEWSCVSESIGMPFLHPGTTIIKFGNRTIYKAQRDFQESSPYARHITTLSNSITWDDGDFQYRLVVTPITNNSSVISQP